ncbi:hypothetical protein [Lentzea indica]|uniref:hypothetical protein n=1 Tax=Lentzea indica TaxID=2604800 RepID=UPI001FE930A7|nr:hypothetical protein [Lentzea indica]
MSVQNRTFTQRAFTNVRDRATGGNLPFSEMLESVTPDLDGYFKGLATTAGKTWPSPRAEAAQAEPTCSGDQGPVAYCPSDKTIKIDTKDELPALHKELGDYATGTLIATRYALAELAVLGKPTEGEGASAAALCLAGAYTGSVFQRQDGFGLSPGDFDEAVTVLLRFDYAARDAKGEDAVDPGFQRVARFREGVFEVRRSAASRPGENGLMPAQASGCAGVSAFRPVPGPTRPRSARPESSACRRSGPCSAP